MSAEDIASEKNINWRSVPVRRERQLEPVTQRLSSGATPIFKYFKDLMVFAALVGYADRERRPLSGDTISIILDTYATDQLDGFIYLLGLIESRDANVLRDENLLDCIKVFEEYCNAGLHSISRWLDDNPSDPDGVETLLIKVQEELAKSVDYAEQDPTNISIID